MVHGVVTVERAVAEIVDRAGGDAEPDLGRMAELEGLRDKAGNDVLPRLMATYLKGVWGSVGDLHHAVSHGDAKLLSEAAHRLRGSSLSYGFTALGDVARSIEALGSSGSVVGAAPLVARASLAAAVIDRQFGGAEPYRADEAG